MNHDENNNKIKIRILVFPWQVSGLEEISLWGLRAQEKKIAHDAFTLFIAYIIFWCINVGTYLYIFMICEYLIYPSSNRFGKCIH